MASRGGLEESGDGKGSGGQGLKRMPTRSKKGVGYLTPKRREPGRPAARVRTAGNLSGSNGGTEEKNSERPSTGGRSPQCYGSNKNSLWGQKQGEFISSTSPERVTEGQKGEPKQEPREGGGGVGEKGPTQLKNSL